MQSGPNEGAPSPYKGLSFAPVGLDVGPVDHVDEEGSVDVNLTGDPKPVRATTARRKVDRAARVGAGAGVLLLLVTGFARFSHRDAPSRSANPSASEVPSAPDTPKPAVPPLASAATPPAPPAETPTTGTVRLRRPASPGHVWLDGAKLTAVSSLVSCGTHQVKVGARAKPRTIDVPCGAPIEITR